MMRDAELAKGEAKRLGGARTEPFSPQMKSSRDNSVLLLEDLKKALQQNEISFALSTYRPFERQHDSGV